MQKGSQRHADRPDRPGQEHRRPGQPGPRTRPAPTLQQIADAAKQLFTADGAGLMLVDAEGQLRWASASEVDWAEFTQVLVGEGVCAALSVPVELDGGVIGTRGPARSSTRRLADVARDVTAGQPALQPARAGHRTRRAGQGPRLAMLDRGARPPSAILGHTLSSEGDLSSRSSQATYFVRTHAGFPAHVVRAPSGT
jgi:hypothetical protein